MRIAKLVLSLPFVLVVACTNNPNPPKIDYSENDVEYIENYKTASGGKYKLGKAYLVNDEWYYPNHEPTYDKEGTASWYGNELAGRPTANGEIFDPSDFTAAHTTLPMPSIVEVTNLDNGRRVNVRVNDRGPFHSKRIIDVSHAAAEALDMLKTGTARVRVRLLTRETLEFMQYQYANSDVSAE